MYANEPDPGVAGRSARREYQRSQERRRRTTRPRPWLLNVLIGPSAPEKWAAGARGEELVAESLAKRCPTVPVLHDRAMPHSRANIDHIAVAASGVYVIDAKRYHGKIDVRQPVFGQARLRINGRDKTKLVEGLAKQVAVVQAVLADLAPNVPVHGCFCFVAPDGLLADVGLPTLRTLKISGYSLYYLRRLAKRLNCSGPLTPQAIAEIHTGLAELLPPA
jgi:Nuclease-related domain